MTIQEILEVYEDELKENQLETIYSELNNNSRDILTSFLLNDCKVSNIGSYFYRDIPNSCFKNCLDLTHIELNDTVISIKSYAFMGCDNLKSIYLGKDLEKIASGAFYNCLNLESINIPDRVTSIGPFAFQQCEKLNNLDLGVNLKTIGWNAFIGCTNLKKIIIHDKVTEIQDQAFWECGDKLTIAYLSTTNRFSRIKTGKLWCQKGTVVHCTNGDIIVDY